MPRMSVSRKINGIFKNLYSLSTLLLLYIAMILFISLSAQFIGNHLSKFLLNHRSITAMFITNDNIDDNKDLDKIIYVINNNPNFKNLHIKTKKIEKSKLNKIKKNTIIITKDEDAIKQLSLNNKLAILDKNIFDGSLAQYTKFSKFYEYALVDTNEVNIKLYIAYTSTKKHKKKVKILSILQAFNKTLFKKDLEDPNEENWFENLEKNKATQQNKNNNK